MSDRRRDVLQHKVDAHEEDRAAMTKKGAATNVSANMIPVNESVSAPFVN
jgi:hypothetical protein